MIEKKVNTPSKYVCIAKVGDDDQGKAICVKYHTSNLVAFTEFLDEKFSDWRYFNVYSKKTKLKLDSFTKNKRPTSMYLKM